MAESVAGDTVQVGAPEPAGRTGGWPRWLVAPALAASPLLLLPVSVGAWWDRLPARLPSHWGFGQEVTDTAAREGLYTAMVVVGAVGAVLGLLGAVTVWLPVPARRILVTGAAAVTTFAVGMWLSTAWVALDVADPHEAPAPTWHVTVLVLAATALGVAVFRVTPRPPPPPAATGRPAADLPRADPASPTPGAPYWQEELRTRHPALLSVIAVTAAAGVGFAVLLRVPWIGLLLLLAAALPATAMSMRLVVDADGLWFGFGRWAWPRVRVPLREIEHAALTEVRASEWGGWGYRFQGGGRRALVAGSGPGVRLSLSAGRSLVVSTGAPETVAGLLNTLVERSRG